MFNINFTNDREALFVDVTINDQNVARILYGTKGRPSEAEALEQAFVIMMACRDTVSIVVKSMTYGLDVTGAVKAISDARKREREG